MIRAKTNLQYRTIKWKRRLPRNVLSDLTVGLISFYPEQYYPEALRLVKYWDEQQEREFVFLTNATHISALQVAELYKNRWQVELFFKWLKQHLKVKKFWGYYQERCTDPGLCRYLHLLPGGHRPAQHETGQKHL